MEAMLFRTPMNHVIVARQALSEGAPQRFSGRSARTVRGLIDGPRRLLSVRHSVNEGATSEIVGQLVRGGGLVGKNPLWNTHAGNHDNGIPMHGTHRF